MKKRAYLVLLLLAASVFLFALDSSISAAQDDLQAIEDSNLDENAQMARQAPKDYSPADKLTTITVTRQSEGYYYPQTNTGKISEKATFRLSGYLREIDPTSDELTMYADRAFELKDGTVEWDVELSTDKGGIECDYIDIIKGKGKDSISNLNIPYDTNGGKDESGNTVHLEVYDLKLKYVEKGESGGPELSVVGKILVPVDYTQSIIVTKTKPHVSPICNGNTQSVSETKRELLIVGFPFTFLNADAKRYGIVGEAEVQDATGYYLEGAVSGYQDMKYGGQIYVSSMGAMWSKFPWKVSFDVELYDPSIGLNRDSDYDGLSNVREGAIGTDPKNPDTDGDGLFDGWEVDGVMKNGQNVLDLPAMGANPLVRDIFLEIDWMEDATKSYKPERDVIQRVVNVFDAHGIKLHVDTGGLGGGNALPMQRLSAWNQWDFYYNASEEAIYRPDNEYLFDIKRDNFDPNRLGIFYYAIFVREKRGTSGQTEIGGNFYVALRHNATITKKSGTLMHELGHALQIGHGGRLDDDLTYDNTHFKPNFRSIMNYHFQLGGIPYMDPASGKVIYLLDYSEEALPALDETAGLDEAAGLSAPDTNEMSYYTCANTSKMNLSDVLDKEGNNLKVIFKLDGAPVDWNCDGRITPNTAANLNGRGSDEYNVTGGTLQTLYGRSDWDKIVLKIGCPDYGLDPNFGINDLMDVSNESNWCPEHEDIRNNLGVAIDEGMPPEVPFIGEACDGIDNNGDGQIDEGCPDKDGDKIVDDLDNCPDVYNPDQKDSNNDYAGDACSGQANAAVQPASETEGQGLPRIYIIIGAAVAVIFLIIIIAFALRRKPAEKK